MRPMKGKRTNKTTRDSSLEINDMITKKILSSKNTWTKWNHVIESNTMILKTKGNCVLAFFFLTMLFLESLEVSSTNQNTVDILSYQAWKMDNQNTTKSDQRKYFHRQN